MSRHTLTESILMLIIGTVIALGVLLTSCGTVHRAQRQYNDNARVAELLESYYITRENPENNTPNEQDSIITLIRKEIRK